MQNCITYSVLVNHVELSSECLIIVLRDKKTSRSDATQLIPCGIVQTHGAKLRARILSFQTYCNFRVQYRRRFEQGCYDKSRDTFTLPSQTGKTLAPHCVQMSRGYSV